MSEQSKSRINAIFRASVTGFVVVLLALGVVIGVGGKKDERSEFANARESYAVTFKEMAREYDRLTEAEDYPEASRQLTRMEQYLRDNQSSFRLYDRLLESVLASHIRVALRMDNVSLADDAFTRLEAASPTEQGAADRKNAEDEYTLYKAAANRES